MVSSVGAGTPLLQCGLLYNAPAQRMQRGANERTTENSPDFRQLLKENGKLLYKNFTVKEFMPDNRDAKLGDAKEYGTLAQAISASKNLLHVYKTKDEIPLLGSQTGSVNFSDGESPGSVSGPDGEKNGISTSSMSEELAGKFSSLQELNDTYDLLQQADVNKDGQVTKKELLQLKKFLEKQRDELNKIKTDKKVMESLQGSGAAKAQQKQVNEISKKIKQIDKLLQKDASGNNLFGDIASEFGDGQSVDLKAFGKAVVEANTGTPIDVSV